MVKEKIDANEIYRIGKEYFDTFIKDKWIEKGYPVPFEGVTYRSLSEGLRIMGLERQVCIGGILFEGKKTLGKFGPYYLVEKGPRKSKDC